MPFVIVDTSKGFCVFTQDEHGAPKGDSHGCHPTRAEAERQLRALYASVPEARKEDGMYYFDGDAIKASGNGNIEGILVPFGSVDSDGDLFDAETDFDFEPGERRSGYFRHSLDPAFGNRRIGRGTLTKESRGIVVSGQLNLADPAVGPVWERAKKGELALSSGAPNHLVRRHEVKAGVTRVTDWPIAEWSVTPNPANREARILSVKEYLGEEETKQGKVFSSENLTKLHRIGDGVQDLHSYLRLSGAPSHVVSHVAALKAAIDDLKAAAGGEAVSSTLQYGDTQQQMLRGLGQSQDLRADPLAVGRKELEAFDQILRLSDAANDRWLRLMRQPI